MQEKTISELAISYRETRSNAAFIELKRRIEPLIFRHGARVMGAVSRDDILQAASVGILKALVSFDAKRGPFEAFVTAFIIGEINAQAAAFDVVKLSSANVDRDLSRCGRAARFVERELNNGMAWADAVTLSAGYFNVSREKIESTIATTQTTELRDEDYSAGECHGGLTERDHRDVIARAMSSLTEAEQMLMKMHLRAEGAPTSREAAHIPGVHVSNSTRITRRAIAKMRSALDDAGIRAVDVFA